MIHRFTHHIHVYSPVCQGLSPLPSPTRTSLGSSTLMSLVPVGVGAGLGVTGAGAAVVVADDPGGRSESPLRLAKSSFLHRRFVRMAVAGEERIRVGTSGVDAN